MASVSISGDLIAHVRTCFELSLEYVLTGEGVRHGMNAYTPYAFPAYVSAVAAVEAFLNEQLLGEFAKVVLSDSPLWNLGKDSLEKIELKTKLIVIPQVLFGRSFTPGSAPYQDFALLIRVRNDVIHYKMGSTPPSYVQPLSDRGIALTTDKAHGGVDYVWPHKLSSTEGIRWAHNSACRTVNALVGFIPLEHKGALSSTARNFEEIDDSDVRSWFEKHGLR